MATAPNTLSGKSGEVFSVTDASILLDVTNWTLTHGLNIETYAARSGAGAQETQAGLENGTGTVEAMMVSSSTIGSLFASGDLIDLELRHTAGGSVKWAGCARIGQISTGANRDGTMQTYSFDFTCHGTWTVPSA